MFPELEFSILKVIKTLSEPPSQPTSLQAKSLLWDNDHSLLATRQSCGGLLADEQDVRFRGHPICQQVAGCKSWSLTYLNPFPISTTSNVSP